MIRYLIALWRKVRHYYNPRWKFYRDTIMKGEKQL